MVFAEYNIEELAAGGAMTFRRGKKGNAYELQDTLKIGTHSGIVKIGVPESLLGYTVSVAIEPKKMWWQNQNQ